MRHRRLKYLQMDFEMLVNLSRRFGDPNPCWSFGGGVDLELIVWLVGYFVDEDQLPKGCFPTWVWPDPAKSAVCVMICSDTFKAVDEGDWIPMIGPVVDQWTLERAIAKTMKERASA